MEEEHSVKSSGCGGEGAKAICLSVRSYAVERFPA